MTPLRWIYLAVGLLFLAIGTIDLFIPLMPSTIFFILALWCFKRSSKRMEEWMLYRSPAARTLQDWERDRSMHPKAKRMAISMVWVGIGLSIAFLIAKRRESWTRVFSGEVSLLGSEPRLLTVPILLIVALSLTYYIASRKTALDPVKIET